MIALLLLGATGGCSTRTYIVQRVANVMSSGGDIFSTHDDPDLVRDAAPFALKVEEYVLSQEPAHRGLLASLSRGFTQYASSFVLQDALEERDRERADAGTDRAKRLLLRAKEYGMRGLEAAHPGFGNRPPGDREAAAAMTGKEDGPLLFLTAASWSLSISLSGAGPHTLARLPPR